jgi:hypothetical protein
VPTPILEKGGRKAALVLRCPRHALSWSGFFFKKILRKTNLQLWSWVNLTPACEDEQAQA